MNASQNHTPHHPLQCAVVAVWTVPKSVTPLASGRNSVRSEGGGGAAHGTRRRGVEVGEGEGDERGTRLLATLDANEGEMGRGEQMRRIPDRAHDATEVTDREMFAGVDASLEDREAP